MKGLQLFFVLSVLFAFTSCKKCDPSNSTGGEVISDAIVRVIGYPSEPIFVTSQGYRNLNYEVSMNDGLNYTPVNFTQHSVLYLPTRANCSSGYDRVVTVDHQNKTVKFVVTITECGSCEAQAIVHNWVLIRAIPADYEYIYEIVKN